MSLTPNLQLDLPIVTTTVGPTWASMVNAAMDLIDAHDHTSDKGVLVPVAGMNFNADVNIGGYNVYNMRTARLANQVSDPAGASDLRILYTKNGELYWKDAVGNAVQITDNGQIQGPIGNITGLAAPASAVYSSLTHSFSFSKDTSKLAKMNTSDLSLYEFDSTSGNAITIKVPTGLSDSYDFTLPFQPPTIGNSVLLSMGPTGAVTLIAGDDGTNAGYPVRVNDAGNLVVTAQLKTAGISDGAVTFAKRFPRPYLAATGTAIGQIVSSASSGTSSTSGSSDLLIPNQQVTVISNGGTIVIELMPVKSLVGDAGYVYASGTGYITLYRDSTAISLITVAGTGGSIKFIDEDSGGVPGTYNYSLKYRAASGGVQINNMRTIAYEIG